MIVVPFFHQKIHTPMLNKKREIFQPKFFVFCAYKEFLIRYLVYYQQLRYEFQVFQNCNNWRNVCCIFSGILRINLLLIFFQYFIISDKTGKYEAFWRELDVSKWFKGCSMEKINDTPCWQLYDVNIVLMYIVYSRQHIDVWKMSKFCQIKLCRTKVTKKISRCRKFRTCFKLFVLYFVIKQFFISSKNYFYVAKSFTKPKVPNCGHESRLLVKETMKIPST